MVATLDHALNQHLQDAALSEAAKHAIEAARGRLVIEPALANSQGADGAIAELILKGALAESVRSVLLIAALLALGAAAAGRSFLGQPISRDSNNRWPAPSMGHAARGSCRVSRAAFLSSSLVRSARSRKEPGELPGQRFSKSLSRWSPRFNRAWITLLGFGPRQRRQKRVEAVKEPIGTWQGDLINEVLRGRDRDADRRRRCGARARRRRRPARRREVLG